MPPLKNDAFVTKKLQTAMILSFQFVDAMSNSTVGTSIRGARMSKRLESHLGFFFVEEPSVRK
jgi:hypothetical protein